MMRFFGMMPSKEIEVEKRFIDKNGLKVTIQAGINGWTIIYADGGSKYQDIIGSTEENFKTAYDIIVGELGEILDAENYSEEIDK